MRWQEFFKHEADQYDDEPFTQGQDAEAETFDAMSQTTLNTMVFETADGPVEIPCRERMYTPTEFTLMLRIAGFTVDHLWGGTAGNWRRGPMDVELMAVASKR